MPLLVANILTVVIDFHNTQAYSNRQNYAMARREVVITAQREWTRQRAAEFTR